MWWNGINVNVGDVMHTGGAQYFYVFEAKDGRLMTQGISEDGDMFNNSYNWSFSYKCDEQKKQKFYDLLERFNLVVDINLKTIRRKYNFDN